MKFPIASFVLLFTLLCNLFSISDSFALSSDTTQIEKRQLSAHRLEQKIVLDGVLDESIYQEHQPTSSFTLFAPSVGDREKQETEVWLNYNDEAIYISARLEYTEIDSLSKDVAQRDRLGNTDWFMVALDPYQSGQNGFSFITTPTNSQTDLSITNGNEDESWDAVWDAKSTIKDNYWTLEIEIPFSALRFPKKDIQSWNINFVRKTIYNQQKSSWNPFLPNNGSFISQFGTLTNLKNIKPPLRIQLVPFAAYTVADYISNKEEKLHNFDDKFALGADLKIGLSEAFTLDMTLVPDFSEANQDNNVLNLSPFEVYFNENRAFFTEGTELFNKGNYFYSRRVGGRPLFNNDAYSYADEVDGKVIYKDQKARILNASKLSGRTSKGLGIGVFNSITAPTKAIVESNEQQKVEIVTQPLSNYNVVSLDQILPNNGSVTFINTNVMRAGHYYDANLSSAAFQLNTKNNKQSLEGSFALSQQYYTNETVLGHKYNIEANTRYKNYNFYVRYKEVGKKYNQSDLGFFVRNNTREGLTGFNYNFNKPIGILNSYGYGATVGAASYIEPNQFNLWFINTYAYFNFKNNWSLNYWNYTEPSGAADRFEPRTKGMYLKNAAFFNQGINISSDSRKKLYAYLNIGYNSLDQVNHDRQIYWGSIGSRYRFTPQLNAQIGINLSANNNLPGYATKENGAPIFGERDLKTVENTLRVNYSITPNMGINLNTRHYWSNVTYDKFYNLNDDGSLSEIDNTYGNKFDGIYNAFTTDLIFKWRFAPGSDLSIIWKDALFANVDHGQFGYIDNWRNGLMNEPRTQSLAVKVNWWLDYNSVQKKIKNL